MKQLTIDDVLGTFDYKAKSTSEQFLKQNIRMTTYEVHFYDKEQKQKIDWFEAILENGIEIQKIAIFISQRTKAEIMELD